MNRLLHILLLAAASLAALPALCGGYDRAYEVSKKAVEFADSCRKQKAPVKGIDNPEQALALLCDSMEMYLDKGWDVDAFVCADKMYRISNEYDVKFDRHQNLLYIKSLVANRGARKLYEWVVKRVGEIDSTDRPLSFEGLDYLAGVCISLNKPEKALEALAKAESFIDTDSQKVAWLARKAFACFDNYDMVAYSDVLDRLQTIVKPSTRDYVDYLNLKAGEYSFYGLRAEADSCRRECAELAAEIYGAESLERLFYANKFFNACVQSGDSEGADSVLESMLGIIEANMGHVSFYDMIFNIGGYLEKKGDERGLELMESAFRSSGDIDGLSNSIGTMSSYLAYVYYLRGNIEDACDYQGLASAIIYSNQGETAPSLIQSQGNELAYKVTAGRYKDAGKLAERLVAGYRLCMGRMFATMSVKERFRLINSERFRNPLGNLIPQLALSGFVDERVAYGAELLRKGLLLSMETDMAKAVYGSGDKELQADYAAYRSALRKIEYLDARGQRDDLRKLEHSADSLERVLSARMSACVRPSTGVLSPLVIHNSTIAYWLGKREIAVEFVEAQFEDGRAYGALCQLGRFDVRPVLVIFGNDKDFDSISRDEFYTSPKLYDLVWKRILELKPGVKKVYFAPSEKFHDIAIEHVPDAAGIPVSEKIEMYRLSSTRELEYAHTEALRDSTTSEADRPFKVALFGGINYYPDEEEFIAAMPDEPAERGAVGSGIDKRSLGSAVPFLPGTLREVSDIADMLGAKGSAAQMYLNAEGSEERFKALSGKGITHLHLATHGFYQPGTGQGSEDTMLDRTGLLMAGAGVDMTEFGSDMPLDDGILTAAEIARMDLDGLDLVVLSACESALGDSGSDGVFGLQRGFKKAGARSILMAVDKVDDNATRILMHSFYRNLLDGHGKAESLAMACRELRQTENGRYDSPRYWAPFIILDAID